MEKNSSKRMEEHEKESMRKGKELEGNKTKEQLVEKEEAEISARKEDLSINDKEVIERTEKETSIRKKSFDEIQSSSNEEQKFQIEKLREHCMELFGVTASTFDGAFYGKIETKLTKQEAQAIINKWLGKE